MNVTEEQQQRGRDKVPNPPKGARANKSRDAMATIEGCVTRLEVVMADVKERLDQLEQNVDSIEGLDSKIPR